MTTVVIPHWNRADLLRLILADLRSQTEPPADILVVDNGSTDHSAEVAAQAGATFLALGANLGFSPAVNRGVAAARTSWVAVVNNDVRLEPAWLARLRWAAEQAGASMASGKLLSASDPARLDGTLDLLCRGGTALRAGHGQPDGPAWDQPRTLGLVPLTAALLRRDRFLQLGGLDERFESYYEDVEFSLRCALHGDTMLYVPEAVAHHQGSATLGRWHPDTVRRIARNQLWLVARHYPASLLLRWAWPLLLAHILWGGVAFRHGQFLPYLRGKMEGLVTFHALRRKASPAKSGGPRLASLLKSHEREIAAHGRQDRYWRWYLTLT